MVIKMLRCNSSTKGIQDAQIALTPYRVNYIYRPQHVAQRIIYKHLKCNNFFRLPLTTPLGGAFDLEALPFLFALIHTISFSYENGASAD